MPTITCSILTYKVGQTTWTFRSGKEWFLECGFNTLLPCCCAIYYSTVNITAAHEFLTEYASLGSYCGLLLAQRHTLMALANVTNVTMDVAMAITSTCMTCSVILDQVCHAGRD